MTYQKKLMKKLNILPRLGNSSTRVFAYGIEAIKPKTGFRAKAGNFLDFYSNIKRFINS